MTRLTVQSPRVAELLDRAAARLTSSSQVRALEAARISRQEVPVLASRNAKPSVRTSLKMMKVIWMKAEKLIQDCSCEYQSAMEFLALKQTIGKPCKKPIKSTPE